MRALDISIFVVEMSLNFIFKFVWQPCISYPAKLFTRYQSHPLQRTRKPRHADLIAFCAVIARFLLQSYPSVTSHQNIQGDSYSERTRMLLLCCAPFNTSAEPEARACTLRWPHSQEAGEHYAWSDPGKAGVTRTKARLETVQTCLVWHGRVIDAFGVVAWPYCNIFAIGGEYFYCWVLTVYLCSKAIILPNMQEEIYLWIGNDGLLEKDFEQSSFSFGSLLIKTRLNWNQASPFIRLWQGTLFTEYWPSQWLYSLQSITRTESNSEADDVLLHH